MTFLSSWHVIFMHASDAPGTMRNILILMDFPFGFKTEIYWNWFFSESSKEVKGIAWFVEEIYCIWKIFQFPHALVGRGNHRQSSLCVCDWKFVLILHAKLRIETWAKGIEFPYHLNWISQNRAPSYSSLKNASFESINLIKSDFITQEIWIYVEWNFHETKANKIEKGDERARGKEFWMNNEPIYAESFFGKSIFL